MHRIRALRPNVSLEEAEAQFRGGAFAERARNIALGPLRSVAEIYIPFRLFEVKISNRGASQTEFIALDVVRGNLDPFRFESVPDTVLVESRNVVELALDESRATELVLANIRRVLYSRGFFRMRQLRLEATALPGDVYIPYWVGLRGRRELVHLTVMDAIRRRMEGGKVRRIVSEWLLSASGGGSVRP